MAIQKSTGTVGSFTALLQALKSFVAGNTVTETLGTGDDVEDTFSGTLSNTNVSEGCARLKFVRNGTTYYIWDDGEGNWDHDEITAATITYSTGAYSIELANPLENAEDLDILYSHGTEGLDWVVIDERNSQDTSGSDAFGDSSKKEIILKNSGSSYKENIFVGIRECESVANSFYRWNLNCYKNFNETQHWNHNKDGTNGHGYSSYDNTRESYDDHPGISFNNDSITYWFYSSKNRIVVIARITGNRYVSCYLGLALRFSSPSDYPNPIIALGSHFGNNNYTDTSDSHSFIIDLRSASSLQLIYLDPFDQFKGSNLPSNSDTELHPKKGENTSGTVTERTDGDTHLYDVYGFSSETSFLLWQLEDVYYCPSNSINSEGTFTQDSKTYRIFQNIFRNTDKDFMCVRET